jgi:hypothetical protein
MAAAADLLRPDATRNVEQDATPVSLAVDVAGAVEHLLQSGDRQLDRFVARRRVLADRGVDGASVFVLDAGRRNEGTIGALWRVALDASAAIGLGLQFVPPGFHAFSERARDGLTGYGIIGVADPSV